MIYMLVSLVSSMSYFFSILLIGGLSTIFNFFQWNQAVFLVSIITLGFIAGVLCIQIEKRLNK